jgi:tRNA uridine 5-carboxymethylaminomethyl modification enzyme
MKTNSFDCIVIGGGHAGVEAAHAAAGIGAKTALVTISKNTIAVMSCNPAIGGLAKGQIAREVDALGGLMGLATDATGIQFRLLNRSKGPAVQSPRAQTDRHKYAQWMRAELEQTPNLTIIEAIATDITIENDKVCAVACDDGTVYKTETVVAATGTFLRGRMYIGDERWSGGRIDEPPSVELSESLKRAGLQIGRLSTCTPPRLDAAGCDLDRLETQPGEVPAEPFSFMTDSIDRPQVPCWITYTNEDIHQMLRSNMVRAPISSEMVAATNPRYCPSIEAKVTRYADKSRHRIFLEPEETDVKTIYCNGLFTSVPKDIQQKLLKMLPGTENARIVRYGYGIEYDYCPPIQLKPSLETKKVFGLFLAGQINGTSGYEEAAGQGIIAGINATAKLSGDEPLVLGRDQAYIGVLIDDLLTMDLNEPYRMFTSRAEYRLSLRSDNADRRLTQIGRSVGLVGQNRWEKFQNKLKNIEKLEDLLKNTRRSGLSFGQLLGRPGNSIADELSDNATGQFADFDKSVRQAVVIDAKYAGYLSKQDRLASSFKTLERKKIPDDLNYGDILHLRAEAREKLSRFRPATLAQAARITGITPADITVVQIHLKKYY